MFEVIDCEQNTEEWILARCGKITASIFDRVITKTGQRSSSLESVINMAVAEVIMGGPEEDAFQSDYMIRGKALESEALRFFNFTENYEFKETGFLDSGLGYGCSPDGIDFDRGMGLELKCPSAHIHLSYLASGKLPDKYKQQVQGSLLVTGFEKWIFGSYHPQFPCFSVSVERDDNYIEKLRKYLLGACEEVQTRVATLRDIMGHTV